LIRESRNKVGVLSHAYCGDPVFSWSRHRPEPISDGMSPSGTRVISCVQIGDRFWVSPSLSAFKLILRVRAREGGSSDEFFFFSASSFLARANPDSLTPFLPRTKKTRLRHFEGISTFSLSCLSFFLIGRFQYVSVIYSQSRLLASPPTSTFFDLVFKIS